MCSHSPLVIRTELSRPSEYTERPPQQSQPRETCGLHDHALGAAAGFLLVVVHVHGLRGAIVAGAAAAAGRVALHLAVVPPNLAHNVVEGPVNVDPRLGRRFDELAAERLGKRLSLCEVLELENGPPPTQLNIPCLVTSLSPSRSHLLPTTTMGK